MHAVEQVLAGGLVSALGWTLIHFLWQGCIIAVIFWIVCILSRRGSAHLRYWAGVGGLALTVLVLGSTFMLYFEPDAQFVAAPPAAESLNSFRVMSGSAPDLRGLLRESLEPVLPLVVALWLCGVLALGSRTALDWYRVRHLLRSGATEVAEAICRSARRIERELGLKRAVRVLQSTRVLVPMAVGWIRPVVLIPAGVLARLPADQLEMVLAHELGHIRRLDHLVNGFQVVLETLLFYHPAIRWMSRRIREERENCCDDLVVSRCGKPATYARALANLEVLRGPGLVSAAMAATGGHLLGRIRRIIDHELPRTSTGYAQLTLMAALAVVTGLSAHQGAALSRALDRVASAAVLQPSDIEWKTWGRARAVWGAGLAAWAERSEEPAVAARSSTLQHSAPVVEHAPEAVPEAPSAAIAAAVTAPVSEPAEPVEAMPAVAVQTETQPSASLPPLHREVAAVMGPVVPEAAESAKKAGPAVLDKVQPRYPWRARFDGLEGFVEVAFSVDGKGRPYDIEVRDSIPSGIFDRAATRAMKRWKFAPPEEGSPMQRLTQTFNFELADAQPAEPQRRYCASTGRRTCSFMPPDAVVVYINPPTTRDNRRLLN